MTRTTIQSLAAGMPEARRLATRLHITADEIAVHKFPDGEIKVTIASPSAPTTIVYAPLDRPNDKLLALMLAAEALRREGARRLVLVAPYLCYMRQDAAFRPGEAISQKVIGRLLADAFDRIVTVDAHLHRTARIADVFPGIEADNLSAMPAIACALHAASFDPAAIVAGPDAESEPWVRDLAGRLGTPYVVASKTRHGDRSVDIVLPDPNAVKGRPVLLVDDLVSSGGTLATCARVLTAAGVTAIDAIVTHALFPPEVSEQFVRAGIRSVRSTTSVPHPTNAIALDALLGGALANEIQ